MTSKIFWMLGAALMILMVVATGGNTRTVSPSGSGKIVFVSSRDPHLTQVFLMNVDGSDLVQLTNSPGSNGCPAFSPDGRKIVFTSNREGNVQPYNEAGFQIYVMNVDGSSVTPLTSPPDEHGCASFSPDGRKIVFTAGRNPMRLDFAVYVMNSDGSAVTQLTKLPVSGFAPPRFSPDGRKILFEGVIGLATMNPDGSNVVRIMPPGRCTNAAFSPDGGKIVAACDGICIMKSDGTNLVCLTDPAQFPYGGGHPAFSPDGRKIAFWAQVESKEIQIFIMNVDGSGVASITSPSVFSFDPAFSP